MAKSGYKRIGLYFKDHLMYVAVVENKTAGFLIAIKDCWDKGWYMLVKELVVSSRHQRKGIGKALIDKIEAESRKKGVKKIYLYSHPEAKAAKFYEKMKYKTEPFVCRSKWMK